MLSFIFSVISIRASKVELFFLNPNSGILYTAYTYDLITLFTIAFDVERFIENVHLLMHADDIIIISTERDIENVHLLMHADDIIIISTERDIGNVHLLMHADDMIIISTERDIGEMYIC